MSPLSRINLGCIFFGMLMLTMVFVNEELRAETTGPARQAVAQMQITLVVPPRANGTGAATGAVPATSTQSPTTSPVLTVRHGADVCVRVSPDRFRIRLTAAAAEPNGLSHGAPDHPSFQKLPPSRACLGQRGRVRLGAQVRQGGHGRHPSRADVLVMVLAPR